MRRQDHRSRRPRGHPSRHHHLHPLHGGVWLRLGKLAQRVPEGSLCSTSCLLVVCDGTRRGAGDEMLTRDKLMKALKQANEKAKFVLAQGCTSDRGIAAQDAQRALQEADEYLAAGDMLEAYGLFCFASGKLYDNHTHWRERFRWLYLEG